MNSLQSHPVLIVEDDPATSELECLVLKRSGFSSVTASNGADAIELLKKQHFAAVLLDYRLPDGVCWNVLDAARSCPRRAPIIVVSAMGDERVAIQAIHRGAADYVVKTGDYWDRLPDHLLRTVMRHDIELQLEESRTRLEAAIQASGTGLWDWNLQTNEMVYSPEWKKQLGIDGDELANTFEEWESRLHPDDKAHTLKHLKDYLDNPQTAYHKEIRLRHNDGSYRWFLSRASVHADSNGRPIRMLGAQMDITERRRAELEAAARARQQAAVAELGQLALSGFGLEQLRECAVKLITDVFDLEYTQVLDLLPDDSVLKPGGPILDSWGNHEETRIWRTLNGNVNRPIRFSVDDLNFFQSMANVICAAAHRARTEKALRESMIEFRTLTEAMPQMVWIARNDGSHVYFNQRWLDYTGLTLDESCGEGWNTPFHPDDRSRALRAWQKAVQTGEPFSLECRLCRKDGSFRVWLVRGLPMRDPSGAIIKWFGTCTDIDELKQAEERMRQSQKMEAIGHLAGGIAHDFNNLLTVIIGHSQLLMDRMKPDDPMNRQVGLILKTGERAANLTRQLLAFSRQQMLQPANLDFNAVIRDMQAMLRCLVREDIAIDTSLDPSLWTISADRGQLEQVILNLVVNARDAMPKGGKIIIETKNIVLDETFTSTRPYVNPGNYIMFCVSDTGCGINPASKARIFEPFFTTKEPGKGTGLGLSTVYGIVKQSGGYIEVYSELNSGTTFKIYLPMVAGLSSASLRAVHRHAPANGNETILLVEDEQDVRELICDVLKSYGYNVLVAKNGKDALRIAEDESLKVDLLMTDIVMPEMGGPDLAKRLFTRRPDIKRLFMSGYTDQTVFQTTLLEQGAAFIQKPFTADSVAQKVREVLDQTSVSRAC